MLSTLSEYEKSFTALRYWMLGKRYYNSIAALEWAREHHTGKRKDGITPEDDHLLQVTLYVTTLHDQLIYPEETVATCLLHDIVEDKTVTLDQIGSKFGDRVHDGVHGLTKVRNGVKRSPEEYFDTMSHNAISSVGKGSDRIHNSGTMVGVFSREKQIEYMEETRKFILPMLKKARKRFPQQHGIYVNAKLFLVSQLQLIEAIHRAADGIR